ncbi:MAG: type II secretion system major pseudopilin GspG [Pseudomonadota bacterium]
MQNPYSLVDATAPANRWNARSPRGFTLIEVMVVMVIIGIMAALVAPKLFWQTEQARVQAATTNLNTIASQLQLFQLNHGRLPTNEEGLQALIEAPVALPGAYPEYGYLEHEDLVDPWGQHYVYRRPGVDAPFELMSMGRDGAAGGEGPDEDIQHR